MNTIAIIGGGASGTIAAIKLLHTLTSPAHIYLIEKNASLLYRGNAYASNFSYEPLNVPSGKMSIYNSDHDNFYNWLLTHKSAESAAINLTKASFVSRRWFGDYVEWNIKQAIANKPGNVKYNEVIDNVQDIESESGTHKITFLSGKVINADVVIFATGNEAPKPLLDDATIADIDNRYENYPWKGLENYNFNKEDDILLVGSGLTMIDNAVSLKNAGHNGKIYILSRHAYLPLPHANTTHLDAPALPATSTYEAYQVLKKIVKDADRAGHSWQSVMDSLRPITTPLWQQLSTAEKKFFFKYLRPYWEIHRHRMPLESANHIAKMQEEGKVELLKGCITNAVPNNGNITVTYKNSKEENTLQVKYIVNCTGPNSDYANLPGTLYNTLAQKGLVSFDELGLGIVTTTNGTPVSAKGKVADNIFSIGPVRKASEWETTAVREIRTQAEELATLINDYCEKEYAGVAGVMAL
jgi:uncharacterized NAD(P)/FAD-binding protein YdhS